MKPDRRVHRGLAGPVRAVTRMKAIVLGFLLGFLLQASLGLGGTAASPATLATATAESANGEEILVALTIDDLPCVGPRSRSALMNMERLVEHLRQARVPATGFVSLARGSGAALRPWVAAGLPLGNHTFTHEHLSRQSVARFIADVRRNETAVRAAVGVELRGGFFRFPYLDHGESEAKVRKVEAFLRKDGYRLAHVSLDTIDYRFASEYGNGASPDLVGRLYLEHLEDCIGHFTRMSRALFGRTIPLIMLIHANELNADFLGRVLERFRARGCRFITLEEAVADPAYQPYLYRPPLPVCRADRNFLNQVALARGQVFDDPSNDETFTTRWLPRLRPGR